MKNNLDYLCEELADAVVRWEQQAKAQRREAAAFRARKPRDKDDRSPEQLSTAYDSAAEMCEVHANTLRKLIGDYSPDALPDDVG